MKKSKNKKRNNSASQLPAHIKRASSPDGLALPPKTKVLLQKSPDDNSLKITPFERTSDISERISQLQVKQEQNMDKEAQNNLIENIQVSNIVIVCSDCDMDYYSQQYQGIVDYIKRGQYPAELPKISKKQKRRLRQYFRSKVCNFYVQTCEKGTDHLYHKKSLKKVAMEQEKKKTLFCCHSTDLHHYSLHVSSSRLSYSNIYWPKMLNDLEDFIQNCSFCKIHKVREVKKPNTKYIKQFHAPMQTILVDFSQLVQNVKNNTRFSYMLNFVEHFSRYKWVFLSERVSQDFVIQCTKTILSQIKCKPTQILSDNGSEFGEGYKKFLETLGIQLIHGRAYYPQSQGAVEAFNKIMKAEISRLFALHPKMTESRFVSTINQTVVALNNCPYRNAYYPKNYTPKRFLQLSLDIKQGAINNSLTSSYILDKLQQFNGQTEKIKAKISQYNESVTKLNKQLLQTVYEINSFKYMYTLLDKKTNGIYEKVKSGKRVAEIGNYCIPVRIIGVEDSYIKVQILINHNFKEAADVKQQDLSKNEEQNNNDNGKANNKKNKRKKKIKAQDKQKLNHRQYNCWEKGETVCLQFNCIGQPDKKYSVQNEFVDSYVHLPSSKVHEKRHKSTRRTLVNINCQIIKDDNQKCTKIDENAQVKFYIF